MSEFVGVYPRLKERFGYPYEFSYIYHKRNQFRKCLCNHCPWIFHGVRYCKNVEFCPLSSPNKEVSVKIIQKHPLPLNILAISTILSLQEVEAQ